MDITPPADMLPLKAGQTFGSVHDPLFARALVLDTGAIDDSGRAADLSGRVATVAVVATSTMPNRSTL